MLYSEWKRCGSENVMTRLEKLDWELRRGGSGIIVVVVVEMMDLHDDDDDRDRNRDRGHDVRYYFGRFSHTH